MKSAILTILLLSIASLSSQQRNNAPVMRSRTVGKFREVFAWKQLTYDINGFELLRDRFGSVDDNSRDKRQVDSVFFNQTSPSDEGSVWNQRPTQQPSNQNLQPSRPWMTRPTGSLNPSNQNSRPVRPSSTSTTTTTTTTERPNDSQARPNPSEGSGRYFIQYNNVPMGAERVGDRLFITVPRRRYGIPSTLNVIDLQKHSGNRSPPLTPYPDSRNSRSLVSVYRTRADACNRLWMVDTGMLEIPNNRQQLQPPAIVVFDLNSDRQILRYNFKSSDLVNANTPAGLASITIDMESSECGNAFAYIPDLATYGLIVYSLRDNDSWRLENSYLHFNLPGLASITIDVESSDCGNAFAYIPDLATYGLIVYSLRDNDSWRLENNYFHFNPLAGNMRIAGQNFQWNDGIFSVTLSGANSAGCRRAFFHPLVSTQEFSVSSCLLKNRTAATADDTYTQFQLVGERGANSQSTMHGYHEATRVVFHADVGRDAVSCWSTGGVLAPNQVTILAQDSQRLVYPSDLHVTGEDVWVVANTMPRFIYSALDTSQYNFFVYRANVQELIAGTTCAGGLTLTFQN